MTHHPNAFYAAKLRPDLPKTAFAPNAARLAWLPVHLGVVAVATVAIALHWLPLVVLPLVALVIGVSFAGLTFLGHETLHGAVVRGRRARLLVGWVCFLPFVISPRLWVAWHNRVHHSHANHPELDPDANPTLERYRASRRVRIVTDYLAPGRRSATGVFGLFLGFSVQAAHVLSFAGKRGYLSPRNARIALLETALGVAVWAAVLALVGPVGFVFVFVLPLVVANAIVMAFIFTNHSLSPLSDVNDPLSSSLSVTAPRWIEWLSLGFGHHVEHHLFPAMSSRHAPLVRDLLRSHWPERYQSMPLWRALLAMHRTGRVYRDQAILTDPRTGREWPALGGAAPIDGDERLAAPPRAWPTPVLGT